MKKLFTLLASGYLILAFTINAQAQKLSASLGSVSNVSCNAGSNGNATVNATGGAVPYTYSWTTSPTQTNAAATGLSAGSYTVTVTDNAATTVTKSVNITQPTTLIYTTSTTNVSCYLAYNGESSVAGAGGTPPYTYYWAPVGGTTSTITSLGAGTLTLTLTDANGCTAQTSSTITQPPQLVMNVNTIASVANALVSGGTIPYTYSWNPPISTSSRVTNLAAGTYTVTVKDAHICEDSALIYVRGFKRIAGVDTSLTLTMANPVTNCGSPSTFEFDILVSSSHYTYFDNCLLYIAYSHDAFGDNIVTNNNVTVTANSDFMPPTYINPMTEIGDISPDTLIIGFGTDPNQVSWNRHEIYSTQQLLHVKINIQNCHTPADIDFTDMDFTTYFSFFTMNATDPQTDVIDYDTTYYNGGITDNTCTPPVITHYTNPINAGTNLQSDPVNSSILTIDGSGFGNTPYVIRVADADDGFNGKGDEIYITLDNSDIISYTNNQIVIRMPSVLSYPDGTPGSGPLVVYTACGDSAVANLQINYSIINDVSPHGPAKLRENIVMANNSESFLWRCDTSVSRNPKAKYCVAKAIREWNCYTGIGWRLEADTGINDSIYPLLYNGISVVYFSPSNFPDTTTLMKTETELYRSCYNASDSVAFVNSANIAINPYRRKWSYDTTGIGYSPDSTYFYDVILHEFGHAHRLNHINDTLSLMCWFTPDCRRSIITGTTNNGRSALDGGLDVVNTSAGNPPSDYGCTYNVLVPSTRMCFDALDVPVITKPTDEYSVNLYPNPINEGDLMITYRLNKDAYLYFKITDCTDRVLFTSSQEHKTAGTYTEGFKVNDLAAGVYLFVANINGVRQTIKFIKL